MAIFSQLSVPKAEGLSKTNEALFQLYPADAPDLRKYLRSFTDCHHQDAMTKFCGKPACILNDLAGSDL
jgi:hypothetical protein